MYSSIQKLKATIQDLSDVHKLQRNWSEDIEAVSLKELLVQVKDLHRDIIESSGAKIFTDFPIAHFRISKRNIFLIFDNLIKNAVQYKSPLRAPEILVSTEEKPDWVILSVKDNGLGIDMSRPDKIFAMFQRLHDHVEGSGVGLYMVKKIIENQGGKVEVESEIGVGSAFKVYFKKSVMVD